MKKLYTYLLCLIPMFIFCQNYKSPTGFTENRGQIVDQNGKANKDVTFLLNTRGLNVQLRKTGFSYDVYETSRIPIPKKIDNYSANSLISDYKTNEIEYTAKHTIHRIDIDFLNANPNTKQISEQKSSHYTNYFNLKHKPEGITDVFNYQKVTYQNIYPNIDVVFFVPSDSTKVVEYNFVVKPGGKISDIQLKFKGAKNELNDNKIKMDLRFGQMEETIPLSWIGSENSNSEIKINYKRIKKNVYGFEGEIDSSNEIIIIDPVPIRLWGTYFGGTGFEFPGTINVDSNNNIIITGGSDSPTNIASTGPNISGYESGGAFIAKFNTNGQFLWGSYYPFPTGLVLDNQDNMYLFGKVTYENTFIPSPGCYQPIKDIYTSGYLIKLNSQGTKLWGTYYGGNGNEDLNGLTVDMNGNIYLVGTTSSSNTFSTPGSFQIAKASPGSLYNGFIAKFDSYGTRIWGTYYGGELSDGFTECFISSDGHLYAIGIHNSLSSNLTTPGSYQPTTTEYGSMIVKFDFNGNRIWGTFIADKALAFGGCMKDNDLIFFGKVYGNYSLGTAGTMSENYIQPLPQNTYLQSYENQAIIKFNVQTQQYIWGTYFFEQIYNVDVDANNNIFFSGETAVDDIVATPNAYMPTKYVNNYKSYLIKLNSMGQKIWGTYYGGNAAEQLGTCLVDQNNDIYLYGRTNGSTTGIASPGAHQTSLGSNPDIYIVKFRDCLSATTISSNSPVCPGGTLNLNASGGTNYFWTGPNGYTSTEQNPSISNTNDSHSGEYTCTITGSTNGCDTTRKLIVLIGGTNNPVPTVENLPNLIGDCNFIVSTIPTANDACSGLINATTFDPLSYTIPGNYTINWYYDDGLGNTFSQTQDVTINAVPEPTLLTPQQFCGQENATLNTVLITGQNIQWYDDILYGNLLPNTTILTDGTTYYASQTINGCESYRVPVTITIQSTPLVTGNSTQSFCSTANATLENIFVNGTNITWYNSMNGTTVLPATTLLLNGTTYYATQTINGCESPTRTAISVSLFNTLNASNYSASICDELNDGSEAINLTNYTTNLITSTGNTFNYYNSLAGATNQNASDLIQNPNNYNLIIGTDTIYVRIDSPNTCFQIVLLNLTLLAKPIVNILDTMPICEGSSININAGAGYDNYLWSTNQTTPSINVTQPGNYSVTVSENHGSLICATTKNFTVVNSNIGTVSQIITSDWTNSENTITVLLTAGSVGNYVYSLNGIDFQSSNTFTGLENGQYTIYVKDLNGCGIVDEEVYLLMYPKFFTPNGDSFNDTWRIKFSETETNFSVKVFDRYGKFITQFGANSAGWDGTFNGNNLPSSDYWFVITRENGKEYRGHFSLKR